MTHNEPNGPRGLSLEEVDGVSGGGSVVGCVSGETGDYFGAGFSDSTSIENTYSAARPLSPVINATLLRH